MEIVNHKLKFLLLGEIYIWAMSGRIWQWDKIKTVEQSISQVLKYYARLESCDTAIFDLYCIGYTPRSQYYLISHKLIFKCVHLENLAHLDLNWKRCLKWNYMRSMYCSECFTTWTTLSESSCSICTPDDLFIAGARENLGCKNDAGL